MHSFLKNNVFSISFGTTLSKLAGCIRQIFIAAAFGVGVTYDAFNYAYIIPSFLLIIIGGINGPLHNAVVAVITPLNKKNGGIVLTQVSIKLSILLMAFAANYTAKLIKKYSWISWVGLIAILFVAVQLIYEDLRILL